MRIAKFATFILCILFVDIACCEDTIAVSKIGDEKFRIVLEKSKHNEKNEFDEFYLRLMESIEQRHFDHIFALILYPIYVEVDGVKMKISDEAEFRRRSDKIFTGEFVSKLVSRKEKLSYLSRGVVVGRGELWLNVNKQDGTYQWRIIAINN
ncbi:hypothetical protein ACO0K2_17315 [Undibacterium sp. MH2W]|uniref:hypothetical protein n=1 Tax=Undibacterium sp. MH2W TaxID=3413044 RepID=UPI003BF35CA9